MNTCNCAGVIIKKVNEKLSISVKIVCNIYNVPKKSLKLCLHQELNREPSRR